MNGRDTAAAAAANLPNDKDAAVMFTVTALNDEEDGLERCVFRLEATAPATHAVQLPYYEGAPQFWQCADAAGATIRYSGMMVRALSLHLSPPFSIPPLYLDLPSLYVSKITVLLFLLLTSPPKKKEKEKAATAVH